MTFITYQSFNFKEETSAIIAQANGIIETYESQGYTLTLRQLYYQFVARGLLENSDRSYKRLGGIITDGRLSGDISWTAIEDNHRASAASAFVQPSEDEVVNGLEYHLALDFWEPQENYVEIWVEKDALLGVVSKAADRWKVPSMACKGYMSASEAWRAGERFKEQSESGKHCYLIHLGDHDPSGIDMTRDNGARLDMFAGAGVVEVRRIALNMDQVKQYSPPPNPAKITDSRATGYIKTFGNKSWELDALEPLVLDKLIDSEIRQLIDEDEWARVKTEQKEKREVLAAVADYWNEGLRKKLVEMMDE